MSANQDVCGGGAEGSSLAGDRSPKANRVRDHQEGETVNSPASFCGFEVDGQHTHPAAATVADLCAEVERARRKFPGNRHLLAALVEEVGELAQAYLQRSSPSDIRKEAIQIACVAIRIVEEGDSEFSAVTDAEAKP
jgi:hypothetical protein